MSQTIKDSRTGTTKNSGNFTSRVMKGHNRGNSHFNTPLTSVDRAENDNTLANFGNDLEALRAKVLGTPRLPPLSELLNLKSKGVGEEANQLMIDLTQYVQTLEHLLRFKNKEIQRLEYMNKYLVIAQQKRDDMLSHTLEENRRLKELSIKAERAVPIEKRALVSIQMPAPSLQNIPQTKKASVFMPRQSVMKPMFESKFKKSSISNKNDSHTSTAGRKSHLHDIKSESILKMNEQDALAAFQENEDTKFLRNLTKDEDYFIEQIRLFDDNMLISLFDAIQGLLFGNDNLIKLTFKMRKIVKAANTMTSSLVLTDAIEKIVEETCDSLSCDRATVFILDQINAELWSKVAKGANSIRIPWNSGIVGQVATTGDILNIKNAYSDHRFNKEVDLKTNYKTNTILCVPVLDESSKVTGVIQAINKHEGLFNKDDEGLLSILASLAGVVLRNSLSYDEEKQFHNNLRAVLRIGIYLNSLHGLQNLIIEGQKKLCAVMNVEKAKICLYDKATDQVLSIGSDGEKIYTDSNTGIIGHVIKEKEFEHVGNAYGHHLYNGKVDIETSMPVLCWPIKHPKNEEEIIGVFQVIHSKGIKGLAVLKKPVINPYDHETLDFFSKQLAQAIINNRDQGSSSSTENLSK